jgi:hypothetical protein
MFVSLHLARAKDFDTALAFWGYQVHLVYRPCSVAFRRIDQFPDSNTVLDSNFHLAKGEETDYMKFNRPNLDLPYSCNIDFTKWKIPLSAHYLKFQL